MKIRLLQWDYETIKPPGALRRVAPGACLSFYDFLQRGPIPTWVTLARCLAVACTPPELAVVFLAPYTGRFGAVAETANHGLRPSVWLITGCVPSC